MRPAVRPIPITVMRAACDARLYSLPFRVPVRPREVLQSQRSVDSCRRRGNSIVVLLVVLGQPLALALRGAGGVLALPRLILHTLTFLTPAPLEDPRWISVKKKVLAPCVPYLPTRSSRSHRGFSHTLFFFVLYLSYLDLPRFP
ncbi:hypothetical protein HYPSUDRAFT_543277 [Hypholoma sublateritium FD-334 SS-4]|uniref:Uncharacterized protein n=1 Tax=Hypholoma sublateritium (strain FD-334 SS-4) TaxID=945553 RepID=A0A0D2LRX2_HYPSF|nr:hypothetical protein HYPSUDRAFT_543277 [Hypholoma sublateritium FD-334 SS-4]